MCHRTLNPNQTVTPVSSSARLTHIRLLPNSEADRASCHAGAADIRQSTAPQVNQMPAEYCTHIRESACTHCRSMLRAAGVLRLVLRGLDDHRRRNHRWGLLCRLVRPLLSRSLLAPPHAVLLETVFERNICKNTVLYAICNE